MLFQKQKQKCQEMAVLYSTTGMHGAYMVFMVFALCFAGLFVCCAIHLSLMMKLQIFARQNYSWMSRKKKNGICEKFQHNFYNFKKNNDWIISYPTTFQWYCDNNDTKMIKLWWYFRQNSCYGSTQNTC